MRWTTPTTMAISSLLGSGCFGDILGHGAALMTEAASSGPGASTVDEPTPTSAPDPGLHTVTGDEPGTTTGNGPGSNSGDTTNAPPEIYQFDADPNKVEDAGKYILNFKYSDDVVAISLSVNGANPKEYLKETFPAEYEVLTAKDNIPEITYDVVVRDAEGLTDAAHTSVTIKLPASGTQKCIYLDLDQGAVQSVISAVKYTEDAIFAVGSRDVGAGFRLALWRLDPNTCEPVPGWPRSISDWSADPTLKTAQSFGTAVDLDEDANIIVGGNLIVGQKPRSYVALITPGGNRAWEKAGTGGEEVAGVAAATGQFSDRVFVVGSRRTNDAPLRTDAAIWIYQVINGEVFIGAPTILKAPFTPSEIKANDSNLLSEWCRGIVIQRSTGNALVVGEREFKEDEQGKVYQRGWTAFVHPLGGTVGTPWTSGAPSLRHDAIRSVAVCGSEFVAGGWTRDDVDVNAKPHPLTFWVQDDGTSVENRPEPQLYATVINGIDCDREGKIVSAGTESVSPPNAQFFAVAGPFGPRITYELGVEGDDGAAAAACDARGFCAWGGYRTAAKRYAVVRVHHP